MVQFDIGARIAGRRGMRGQALQEFRVETGRVAENRGFEKLASLLKRRIAALPSGCVHPLIERARMVFDFARGYGEASGVQKILEFADGQGARVRCVAGNFDVVAGFCVCGILGDDHIEKTEFITGTPKEAAAKLLEKLKHEARVL